MKTIFYNKPALDWNNAFPLGNGRLGAMLYGEPGHEIIQLNEESVWSSAFKKRNNADSRKSLSKIRKLLRENRIAEAQDCVYQNMSAVPESMSMYQSAGELHIDFYNEQFRGISGGSGSTQGAFKDISLYKRELNLEYAIAQTTFSAESSLPSEALFAESRKGSSLSYKREAFIPSSLDVLVYHIQSSMPKSIYFRANFEKQSYGISKHSLSNDTIVMQESHGVPFTAICTAVASGGSVTTNGEFLVVEGADEVTLYIDIQTAFRNSHYRNKKGRVGLNNEKYAYWCESRALEKVCFASSVASYEEMKGEHMAESESLFNSTQIKLCGGNDELENEALKLPVDEFMAMACGRDDGALIAKQTELYSNYSRYLLLASGGKNGTLPVNLQGLWNKSNAPLHGSRFMLNGMMAFTYRAAMMNGLEKLSLPMFKLLKRAYKNGVKTAHEMYGADGYVLHTALDIWGDSAPQGKQLYRSYSLMGAAIMAVSVRDYYEYTQDKKFLKKYYYLLKSASDFFTEYMIPSDEGDFAVVNPSVSPYGVYKLANGESGAICGQSDYDNRVVEYLLECTLKSAKDLGVSPKDADVARYEALLSKIEKPCVAEDGTIREWKGKVEKISKIQAAPQLYGLFPGNSINEENAEVCAGAYKTLMNLAANEKECSTFNEAVLLNGLATLGKGEECSALVNGILRGKTQNNLVSSTEAFNVTSNMAVWCGFTRMIAQSRMLSGEKTEVEIKLLPALCKEWKSGSVKNLLLKGNIRLDAEWNDGGIVSATLYKSTTAKTVENICLVYDGHRYECRLAEAKLDLLNVLPSTVG